MSDICCPLCQHRASAFYHFKHRLYYQCEFCQGIFPDKSLWPTRQQEKSRYLEHLNEVTDLRFQQFVSPITNAVFEDYQLQSAGLDFGAGHAPIISHVLSQQGYNIASFDPLFFNDTELLAQQYDYICSCEVIEHFHHPQQSFQLLQKLLKPFGRLYCMTELYHEGINFHRWNYKNDPTHVFIYHRNTVSYIARRFGFSAYQIAGRLITFKH